MRGILNALAVVFLASLALGGRAAAADASGSPPGVVVSVQPLHALVAGVMRGLGEPHLVVRGQGSPHTYRMRPSDARALARARLVVWLGPDLETFLIASMRSLAGDAEVIEVARLDGIVRYPTRAGGAWSIEELAHAHGHDHDDGDGDGESNGDRAVGENRDRGPGVDPHVWLDPHNAVHIVHAVAARLAALDPPRAAGYRENAAAMAGRLETLDAELEERLAPVRDVPYLVLHDAYQYLERRYRLRAVGAVTVSPDRMPGARRIAELRRRVRALEVRCVFGEPQIDSPLLASVAEGEPVRVGVLDPLGAAYPPGPDAYFLMMEANAAALGECLGG